MIMINEKLLKGNQMNIEAHHGKVEMLIEEFKTAYGDNDYIIIGALASKCVAMQYSIDYWKNLYKEEKEMHAGNK